MQKYSDKIGDTCSNNSDCFPYGWCGNGRCQQGCPLNNQGRRGYYCRCDEGGANQNCPQGTSCQNKVCKPLKCPAGYADAPEGPIFFLQPGNKYTNPILNNTQPSELQDWSVDKQFKDTNFAPQNKIAEQIQDFVSANLEYKPNGSMFCSLFVSGGRNSRLGRLGGYKQSQNKYTYQMSYGTGQTTEVVSFTGQPQYKNTQPITLQNNNQEAQELEKLKQQIASNKISIETYNRKIEELKEEIIVKRADADRKERLVETQNRQVYGQSKDLENKINLLQTRKAMLDVSIDRNNFKNKQIYTQITGICSVLIIMILLYVFFNKFYQS